MNSETARPGDSTRASILVVEDEEVVRDFLTSALELDGYDVEAVEDGRAALEYLKQGPVDLIIADCLMPVMDGCRLHEELRQRNDPHADRMIFISGAMGRDPVRTFLNESGAPALEKPFGTAELREILTRVLGH